MLCTLAPKRSIFYLKKLSRNSQENKKPPRKNREGSSMLIEIKADMLPVTIVYLFSLHADLYLKPPDPPAIHLQFLD